MQASILTYFATAVIYSCEMFIILPLECDRKVDNNVCESSKKKFYN
jgi:hypothetical protein